MVLSILICTYNREHFLKQCLDSIIEQTEQTNEKEIEVIIIDNNSSDNTKSLVESYNSSTKISYYLENKQGLSHARNAGVQIAKGNYIAFVDDDAIINKEWLTSLSTGIKNIQADVFGGPIYPKFEIECPSWIDKEYFIRKFKSSDGYLRPLIARGGFSGGNMCIHKSIFQKVGVFNTELGMKGNKLGLGEESELFYRIYTKLEGIRLYNLEKMSITHFEASFKLEKKYLRERIILSGQQFSFQNIKENLIKGYIFIFLKLTKQSFDLLLNLIRLNKFNYSRNLWTIQGIIKGIVTQ